MSEVQNDTITDNFIKENSDGIDLYGSHCIQTLYNNILTNAVTRSGEDPDSGSGENTVINCNNIEGNI